MPNTKLYTGQKATDFLPDIVGDDRAVVISPIKDIMSSNADLGHILYIPKCQLELDESSGRYKGKPFTEKQTASGFKGSFVFIGNNPMYFNHLFQSKITGKYSDTSVFVDQQFRGMISFDFLQIFRNYLVREMR